MKIAIAQINPIIGDIQHNKELIIEQISIAKANEVELIVFGEMAMTGMPLLDLVGYQSFVEKALLAISEIAEYVKDIDVLIGTPTQNDEDTFNTFLHLKSGEIVAEYSKAMITSRDELNNFSGVESEYFPEGELLENIITVRGERLFLAIGNDIDYIDQLEMFNGMTRFKAIINPVAQRYYHYVGHEMVEQLQSIAQKVSTPIISVNLVGANTDIIYYGGSAVISGSGALINKCKTFEEDLLIIETEDIETYKNIGNKKPSGKAKTKELRSALVLAIKDYFSKNGFQKTCLGLSGGIDSALVLSLAVEALGAENVDAILMPSKFSSNHSITDSIALAKNLGVKYHEVNINNIFEQFNGTLEPIFGDLPFSIAEENIQSRIRGSILMAYSNKFGHIILNTTNKCEAAMGYGTLYGDTNGAISILGDVYKGEIYDLCRLINDDKQIIPQNIIDKAPSAELRPNQKDTDSLPEYDILDKLLYSLIEESKSIEELLTEGFDPQTVKQVVSSLNSNEYKRFQLPPVIRVSRIVMGKDIIMPLTAKM